ncbi:MAG TPA: RluA family pseudouridine synthase [Patescibacteria group bacterium]|nr:RluA family pseudouridine synthase [Patescibacteria group bacterium]
MEELKCRVDKYLAERVSIPRSRIQREIENGQVTVNGVQIFENKTIVRLGDKITYIILPPEQEKPKNIFLKTLYEGHGLLIIDKPPGLTVHNASAVKGDTLTEALLFHYKDIAGVGEKGRPGIVHRLDKDTSGCILVATTQEMYEYLKEAFATRKVRKEYVALVQGTMEKIHGEIDTPIGKSKTDFRKYDTKNILEPKESLTEYKVLENLDIYSLLLVKLHTGRTHQIRVHFKSLGHPLVGDELYGGKKALALGLTRQFLHARRIEVQLPDGTWIEAESELPEDLKDILRKLHSKKVNLL